jgi:hypothetical protein
MIGIREIDMRATGMVLVALLALPTGAHATSSEKIVDAAVLGSELVTVDNGGAVDAWSIPLRERNEALTAALSARALDHVASDGSVMSL